MTENSEEITPIEEYKGILLKRDDKFRIGNCNGGKLRQAIFLLSKNYEDIVKEHNNNVVCSCSIKSPQSAITATVCKMLNLNCNIVVYKTKIPNENLTIAQEEGANIYGIKSGYTSVVDSFAKTNFKKDFFTNMGFSSGEIIEANINQVSNIPDEIDYLVVTVGSAMNFISILKGIIKFNKKVKNIIGVYVGKNPLPNLQKYGRDIKLDYTLVKYDKSYGTWLNIDDNFFDPIYEAKAFDWINKNIDIKNNKVLLWIIGKRNLEIKTKEIEYKNI